MLKKFGIGTVATVLIGIIGLAFYWVDLCDSWITEIAPSGSGADSTVVEQKLKNLNRFWCDMTEMQVSPTILTMVEFENVNWSGSTMRNVEFNCSYPIDRRIFDWVDGDKKLPFCAQLECANFTGTKLRDIYFRYADLRHAKFNDADLTRAEFINSDLSGAELLEGVTLRGVHIIKSDFSYAQFSEDAQFRNARRSKQGKSNQARIERSNFSSAEMRSVKFRDTEISNVDFTGANLNNARFYCKNESVCTSLKDVCMQGADLTDTKFENVKISNVDFSHITFNYGTKFDDVIFESIVLSHEETFLAQVDLDKSSKTSLNAALKEGLRYESLDEKPCDEKWRNKINKWKQKF